MPFDLIKRPNFKALSNRLGKAEEEWLEDLADFLIDEHHTLTSNWKSKPKFDKNLIRTKGNKALEVVTKDANWLRVNFGTGLRGPKKRSYTIKPKKPRGLLSFLSKYTPKTTRSSHGGSGQRSGMPVLTKKVTAKGIRPRRFDLRVKDAAKKKFYPKWTNVLRRAITRR